MDYTNYTEFHQFEKPINDLTELTMEELHEVNQIWFRFRERFPGWIATNLFDQKTNRLYFYVTGRNKYLDWSV